MLGKIFGARHTAPTNVAGFVTVLLALLICFYAFWGGDRKEVLSVVAPLLTGSLGFMFGSNRAKP